MPPEMMLAGSLVAQMMVEREKKSSGPGGFVGVKQGTCKWGRGLFELELGKPLGRKVKGKGLGGKGMEGGSLSASASGGGRSNVASGRPGVL
ncbi:hypothetical protein HDU76_009073 [Blyttiomyces sp. JEL0837]|nr:hypothetical protein HDU76_009073 [Blyttiomyces sp. JEL0837]